MRILLAEDDPLIATAIVSGLRKSGFSVDWVQDGQAAASALALERYGLLILDLGLPKVEGLELLARIRQEDNRIPVLIVTARGDLEDRVTGLNEGADDYLVKPFDLEELIARVFALARRFQGRASSELQLGGLLVDPRARTVRLDGKEVALSDREFRLLLALLENPGAVLSIQQLEDKLYGWGEEIASNTIEVQLHRLRRKLGKEWIRNIRGVGFKIVTPS
ncbi:MAG: response regulator transcription factor [Azonexaceae bacterium]|uniref:response regulator transcription factor n=1 Tax=Azonexus sp. R2A61 TaxID=2744443 RepID=UPI001F1B6E36|nr:response regulator transcription factor [Azonexus sp. R2A61]MCE1238904.1 response regulator transcription factor [Azonexaceae bacterium]